MVRTQEPDLEGIRLELGAVGTAGLSAVATLRQDAAVALCRGATWSPGLACCSPVCHTQSSEILPQLAPHHELAIVSSAQSTA